MVAVEGVAQSPQLRVGGVAEKSKVGSCSLPIECQGNGWPQPSLRLPASSGRVPRTAMVVLGRGQSGEIRYVVIATYDYVGCAAPDVCALARTLPTARPIGHRTQASQPNNLSPGGDDRQRQVLARLRCLPQDAGPAGLPPAAHSRLPPPGERKGGPLQPDSARGVAPCSTHTSNAQRMRLLSTWLHRLIFTETTPRAVSHLSSELPSPIGEVRLGRWQTQPEGVW